MPKPNRRRTVRGKVTAWGGKHEDTTVIKAEIQASTNTVVGEVGKLREDQNTHFDEAKTRAAEDKAELKDHVSERIEGLEQTVLHAKEDEISDLKAKIAEKDVALSKKDETIAEKDQTIQVQTRTIDNLSTPVKAPKPANVPSFISTNVGGSTASRSLSSKLEAAPETVPKAKYDAAVSDKKKSQAEILELEKENRRKSLEIRDREEKLRLYNRRDTMNVNPTNTPHTPKMVRAKDVHCDRMENGRVIAAGQTTEVLPSKSESRVGKRADAATAEPRSTRKSGIPPRTPSRRSTRTPSRFK